MEIKPMCKTICFCHYCQNDLSYYQPPNHQLYHGFASVRLKLPRASAATGSPVCFALLGSFSFNWESGWSWLDWKTVFMIRFDQSHPFVRLLQVPTVALEDARTGAGSSVPRSFSPTPGQIPQHASVKEYMDFCLFLLADSLLNTHQRATKRK